jgi:hypothetical protein
MKRQRAESRKSQRGRQLEELKFGTQKKLKVQ